MTSVSQAGDSSVVSTIRWEANDDVTVVDMAEFNELLLNIDALPLANGNTAFACAGVTSYVVLVVAPDGSIVSQSQTPLPGGCEPSFPGAPAWVRDSGNHIVIPCPDNNLIAVVESGI